MSDDAGYPRFASRGRTFVYAFPCRGEDILKVGFSRDPVTRLRTLHACFFAFFDLERGLLIETDHLRDARRIERLLITTFAAHRASAPLVVRQAAAGHTEWYRGVYPQVAALMRNLCAEEGFLLHPSLRDWLRARFDERSEVLFDWSARMLEMIEYVRCNAPADARDERYELALGRVLDTCAALDMELQALVPPSVSAWYQERQALTFR
jgi:hypothetical protein